MGRMRRLGENPEQGREGELAARLRAAYIRERRLFEQRLTGRPSQYNSSVHWDGGRGKNGSVRQSIWPKVARFVQQYQLDPEAFIRHQFVLGEGQHVILPNQLYNADALRRHREQADLERKVLAAAFGSQQETLRKSVQAAQEMSDLAGYKLSPRDLQLSVLLNESLPLSALFRYCLAYSEGLAKVAAIYKEAAARQYMRNSRTYDLVWGSWIPEEFKHEAELMYRRELRRSEDEDAETE